MKYILSLTILLLAFTRSSNAVLFITCDGDATDCCCSEIYATDCYCAPTCPSDTYRIVSNFSAFLKWPSAAAEATSDLTLTASVKDGICVNANGPGWESVDRTTTTLKRDCTLYGTLGNTIYYTNSNGHKVEVTNSQSFVDCTPSQKTITVQKDGQAYAYMKNNEKRYNQSGINDVTGVIYGSSQDDRSGQINLGLVWGGDDFTNKGNNRCFSYYIPYKFNLNSPNILEYFYLYEMYKAEASLSIVANERLLKTYNNKYEDITYAGRVFYAYGQSDTKVEYCPGQNNIFNIHNCANPNTSTNADCGGNGAVSYTYNANDVPVLPYLSEGTNHIYILHAIKRWGTGIVRFKYKFKDDISVRFLENE